MTNFIRVTTFVQPGGKIEITDSHLTAGDAVDVVVCTSSRGNRKGKSIVDVLSESPGHLAFQNADQVNSYISEERNSWGQ